MANMTQTRRDFVRATLAAGAAVAATWAEDLGGLGPRRWLTAEAADVLYHLLVLLTASDVKLADVMAELEKRTAQSGLAEKAARS